MLAFAQSVPVESTANTIEMITQGSAAAAVIIVVILFLSFIKAERKDNANLRTEDATRNAKERERDAEERKSERETFRSALAIIVSDHEKVMQPIVNELRELRDDTVRIEGKIDRLSDRTGERKAG